MNKQLHGINVVFMLKGLKYTQWVVAYTKAEAIQIIKDLLIYQRNYKFEDIEIIESKFYKGKRPELICEERYQKQLEIAYKGVTRWQH